MICRSMNCNLQMENERRGWYEEENPAGTGDCSDRHCGVLFYFVSHCIGQAEQRTKKDADSEEIRLICIFFAV